MFKLCDITLFAWMSLIFYLQCDNVQKYKLNYNQVSLCEVCGEKLLFNKLRNMRKPQKRELDEVIAFYVEKFFYIALYPLVLLLNVRKLHFASIFNTPLDRRLQESLESRNIFKICRTKKKTFKLIQRKSYLFKDLSFRLFCEITFICWITFLSIRII